MNENGIGPVLLENVYEAVLPYQLQISVRKIGYLLNYGTALMKDGISRILKGKLE